MDENKNIKIIDFGFSNTFVNHEFLETFCGSPFYAAPEMVLGQRYEGPEVDMWSLGIILFTLLCGHLPFDDPNPKELYRKILSGVFSIPDYISVEAKDLLNRMICVDPKRRAKIEDVKQHKWINLGYDSIVCSYFPIRSVLNINQLNPEIIMKLQTFGYSMEEIHFALLDPTLNNPIVNTYYLILEMFQREDLKMKGMSMARGNSKVLFPQPPPSQQLCSIQENGQLNESCFPESANKSHVNYVNHSPPSIKHYRKASLNEEAARMIPQHFAQAIPLHATPVKDVEMQDQSTSSAKKDKHKRRFSLPILDAIMSSNTNNKVSDTNDSLRSINGWFFSVSTTSSMQPEMIISELFRVLEMNGILFHRESSFVLRCFWPGQAPSKVEFEIEVCRIPRLNLNGLNFKRIQGSFWSYKKVCNKLIAQMNL